MIASVICNSYKIEILQGIHQVTDDYYVALFTDSAVLSKDITSYIDVTNEVVGNGYTVGGKLLENISILLDNDTAILDFETDPIWTASTITARGCLIYNHTTIGKNAVGVIDFGANYISNNGEFKITLPLPTDSTALLRII